MTSRPLGYIPDALDVLAQYGSSTTGQIARHIEQPLLKVRSELKSALSMGYVTESNYLWALLEHPESIDEISIKLKDIIESHAGKRLHSIAKQTGLNSRFLKGWLSSEANIFFKLSRRSTLLSVAANEDTPTKHNLASPVDPQQQFIEAPLNYDLVVMAPPGTGKTHALIKRLAWMASCLSSPADMASICVLSFTNNVVNEVINRLNQAATEGINDSVRYINIKTFDSFANRCLIDAGEPVSSKFEENIKCFTQLIKSAQADPTLAPERVADIRWLLIDEVQDLSGARAEMVYALASYLKKHTLARLVFLGDRHQGIYNYSHDGDVGSSFLPYQQQLVQGRECLSLVFKKSYRYSNMQMAELANKARLFLDNTAPVKEQHQQLEMTVSEIPAQNIINWLQDNQGSTAILAGRNKTVANIAQFLELQQTEHTVVEGVASSEWPIWIWQVFHNWQQPVMSRQIFTEKAKTLGESSIMYDSLQSQGVANSYSIDVATLADQVFCQQWRKKNSPSGNSSQASGVILSTIHKAKGLQYDNVLAVTDDCHFAKTDQARLLYVAITRAKASIGRTKRQYLTEKNNKAYYSKGIEHYFLTSLNNFASDELASFFPLLKQSCESGSGIFQIQQQESKDWLCIFNASTASWQRVLRWYNQKGAYMPKDTELKAKSWMTAAWPDDDEKFKQILGPQLLIPLPVF